MIAESSSPSVTSLPRSLPEVSTVPGEGQAARVEIPEQPDRAGPSGRQATHRCDVWGFKGFRHAAITIAGIELMHRIRKGPIRTGPSGCSRPNRACCLERRAGSLNSRRRIRDAFAHAVYLHQSPLPSVRPAPLVRARNLATICPHILCRGP